MEHRRGFVLPLTGEKDTVKNAKTVTASSERCLVLSLCRRTLRMSSDVRSADYRAKGGSSDAI